MGTELAKQENKIVLADLTPDVIGEWKLDQFNALLNQQPRKNWIKEHPYIKGYLYIPIDKVEWLLRKLFKRSRIEITGQGTAFNGVWVTVRVHYFHPVLEEWDFHDGIGSIQLQMRAKTDEEKLNNQQVPFEPENINNGALSMAFPHAKSLAVKDATDHLGDLFGANLNRKDTMSYSTDSNLPDKVEKKVQAIVDACETSDDLLNAFDTVPEQFHYIIEEKLEELKNA